MSVFTHLKNPIINCYGGTALWYILFKSVSSFLFLKPCFMSFKQLLWGDRSSVRNCWRNSFWIIFRQRHVSVYPQDIFYPATKKFGHEYGNVGKIFVHFYYACVPLFCALVVFTAISSFTPFRSHSSWSITMVVPINSCKLLSCLVKSAPNTVHNNNDNINNCLKGK